MSIFHQRNIYIGLTIIVVAAIVAGVAKSRITPQPLNLSTLNTSTTNESTSMPATTYTFPGRLPDEQIKNKQAHIKTNKGDIIFRLDADLAPLAVSNFVYLANQQYFDGLTWHRVVSDFVIQGGDPTGTGSGGPGYQFSDEPVKGEYIEGSVAMANAGPNTNGSQFFISLVDNKQNLQKLYSLFGQVTSGLEVVKKIQVGDKMLQVTIEPVS